MSADDRIELLAAHVARKWRTLNAVGGFNGGGVEHAKGEWAAASLLLELAQDAQTRDEQAYFIATRVAHQLYELIAKRGDINLVRKELIELCKPTSEF